MKDNQPTLKADIQALQLDRNPPQYESNDKGHGRIERREIWASADLNDYVQFPHVGQVFTLRRTRILRDRQGHEKIESETVEGITSLQPKNASPQRLLELSRGHWAIENKVHWVRDVVFDEDRHQLRTKHAPQVMAALRNTAINLIRCAGGTSIASAIRQISRDCRLASRLIGITPVSA